MSVKPITPDECKFEIPDCIFIEINKLIKEKFDRYSSTFSQKELLSKLVPEHFEHEEEIFNKNYLDFEKYYEDVGWSVEYCTPCIGEDFETYFKFTK